MKASGFLAGMMNPILEKFVPQLVEQLVQKKWQLKQANKVNNYLEQLSFCKNDYI